MTFNYRPRTIIKSRLTARKTDGSQLHMIHDLIRPTQQIIQLQIVTTYLSLALPNLIITIKLLAE